jgi:hypothetical protein
MRCHLSPPGHRSVPTLSKYCPLVLYLLIPRFWIAASSESATFMYTQNMHKGHWPALPLIVKATQVLPGTDNIIAALEQSDRVFRVNLVGLEGCRLGEVLAKTCAFRHVHTSVT